MPVQFHVCTDSAITEWIRSNLVPLLCRESEAEVEKRVRSICVGLARSVGPCVGHILHANVQDVASFVGSRAARFSHPGFGSLQRA